MPIKNPLTETLVDNYLAKQLWQNLVQTYLDNLLDINVSRIDKKPEAAQRAIKELQNLNNITINKWVMQLPESEKWPKQLSKINNGFSDDICRISLEWCDEQKAQLKPIAWDVLLKSKAQSKYARVCKHLNDMMMHLMNEDTIDEQVEAIETLRSNNIKVAPITFEKMETKFISFIKFWFAEHRHHVAHTAITYGKNNQIDQVKKQYGPEAEDIKPYLVDQFNYPLPSPEQGQYYLILKRPKHYEDDKNMTRSTNESEIIHQFTALIIKQRIGRDIPYYSQIEYTN